jgi:hypothetical protein
MSFYRITQFTSSDMSKMIDFAETLRTEVAAADAESIDVVSVGEGKYLVIAKYADEALMAAATDINTQAFGKMIAAGLIDGENISSQSGETTFSF